MAKSSLAQPDPYVQSAGEKRVWLCKTRLNPVIEEELSCKREIGNAHDTHALAVRNIIDENIKCSTRIAMHGLIFVRPGSYSSILCIVKGNRRCSSDLLQHRWASIFSGGKENILAIYAQTQPTELNFHFSVSFSALLHVH